MKKSNGTRLWGLLFSLVLTMEVDCEHEDMGSL